MYDKRVKKMWGFFFYIGFKIYYFDIFFKQALLSVLNSNSEIQIKTHL